MIAWWNQEIIDRACIQVTARLAEPRPIPGPEDIRERWLDMEYVLAVADERFRCTYFGGEAYPSFMPNLGPDAFSAYLGAELVFAEGTTWAKPLLTDWDNPPSFELDFSAPWWQKMESMCTEALEFAAGKFFVTIPDGHGGTDGLAGLRGQQQLCYDFADRPEVVREAIKKLDQATIDYYERLFPLFHRYQEGACGFVPAWGPGNTMTSQCDFLALVSPDMSKELIMPGIRMETDYLGHSVFHLDGPRALPHLDMLLEMPGVEAIQWVPGSGNPSASHWLEYLKRVQQAGRSLWLSVSGPDEVEVLMRELSPRGLMMCTHVRSREAADALMADVARWTTDRR